MSVMPLSSPDWSRLAQWSWQACTSNITWLFFKRTENGSMFDRVPPELRLQIWEHVLAFAEDERPPHFHLYDKVYDSCMYRAQSKECAQKRREAYGHTALLRTCRVIYNEALPMLYKNTHFELVLFAGKARWKYDLMWDTAPLFNQHEHDLVLRNNLGELARCPQLKRIRHATVVVQPGESPDVKAYKKRIEDFLAAVAYGGGLKTFSIKFNFPTRIDRANEGIEFVKGFRDFVASLHKRTALSLMPCSTWHEHRTAVGELAAASNTTDVSTRPWQQTQDMEECLRRGTVDAFTFHAINHPPPRWLQAPFWNTTWGNRCLGVLLGVFVGIPLMVVPWTLSLPMGMHCVAVYQRGQRWRWQETLFVCGAVLLVPLGSVVTVCWMALIHQLT